MLPRLRREPLGTRQRRSIPPDMGLTRRIIDAGAPGDDPRAFAEGPIATPGAVRRERLVRDHPGLPVGLDPYAHLGKRWR